MKLIERIKTSNAFKKTVAFIVSASVAMSTVAVNAFAADGASGGGSGGVYSQIADAFGSGISEIGAGIGVIATAIIPVAVGIMGVYAALGAGKKILTKLSG